MLQVTKILDKDKTKIVYNSEWLSKMTFKDVLTLTSKYTVARILERDDFKKRYNEEIPIGIHEFLYPLMQGFDSVEIKADVEIGGTDQTFNLLVGRELQRDYGETPQDVMVFPLLVGLDGKEKMSKSLDNYIGIDESAEVMYEKCMRIPDSVLEDYFLLTTDIKEDIYKEYIKNDIVEAHKRYAEYIVKMYCGIDKLENAIDTYENKRKGQISNETKGFKITTDKITLIDLLVTTKLCKSKSEAKRLILQSGIKVNGFKECDVNKVLNKEYNTSYVIQKGKNILIKVTFE